MELNERGLVWEDKGKHHIYRTEGSEFAKFGELDHSVGPAGFEVFHDRYNWRCTFWHGNRGYSLDNASTKDGAKIVAQNHANMLVASFAALSAGEAQQGMTDAEILEEWDRAWESMQAPYGIRKAVCATARAIEARVRYGGRGLEDILKKMASAKLEDSLGPHHLALCLKQMANEALELLGAELVCRTCGHAVHPGESCVNIAPSPLAALTPPRQMVADSAGGVSDAARTDLLAYVLQDDLHNRLTPRVIDIAYTAFMRAMERNTDDGGPCDWFNDTRPIVKEAIAKLRKDLFEDRAASPADQDARDAALWRAHFELMRPETTQRGLVEYLEAVEAKARAMSASKEGA